MGANGCGNFCNYWVFVTLMSTHWRIVSAPLFALCAGSFTAWMMNYACARFWIFRGHEHGAAVQPPVAGG